jgi:hypothetical protein
VNYFEILSFNDEGIEEEDEEIKIKNLLVMVHC